MTQQLDEYRATLVNKILFAVSQEQVKEYIDEAMKSMQEKKINKHIIIRFLNKMINDLAMFNPMKKQAQQWDNIKVAKILLNRIWIELNTPAD